MIVISPRVPLKCAYSMVFKSLILEEGIISYIPMIFPFTTWDHRPGHWGPQMSLSSMDAGAVDLGLACAWYGPEGTMISNEDVKKLCEACHGGWATVGVATLRRCRALKCGNIASGREYTAGFF